VERLNKGSSVVIYTEMGLDSRGLLNQASN